MITYRLLRRYLPHRVSLFLTLLLMLILIALSMFYGFEPQGEFRYQDI